MKGTKKTWTDEMGKEVEIFPFFSVFFIDEETRKLNRIYDISEYSGEVQKMGKTEKEGLVEKLLRLYCVKGELFGVKKNELDRFTREYNENYFIKELVSLEYLRVKTVKGERVIFPTRSLLEEQKIPKYE